MRFWGFGFFGGLPAVKSRRLAGNPTITGCLAGRSPPRRSAFKLIASELITEGEEVLGGLDRVLGAVKRLHTST